MNSSSHRGAEEDLAVEPLRVPRPEGFPDRKRSLDLEDRSTGAWLDYRVQRRPSSDWTRTPDWRGTTPDDPLVREVVELVRQTTS